MAIFAEIRKYARDSLSLLGFAELLVEHVPREVASLKSELTREWGTILTDILQSLRQRLIWCISASDDWAVSFPHCDQVYTFQQTLL